MASQPYQSVKSSASATLDDPLLQEIARAIEDGKWHKIKSQTEEERKENHSDILQNEGWTHNNHEPRHHPTGKLLCSAPETEKKKRLKSLVEVTKRLKNRRGSSELIFGFHSLTNKWFRQNRNVWDAKQPMQQPLWGHWRWYHFQKIHGANLVLIFMDFLWNFDGSLPLTQELNHLVLKKMSLGLKVCGHLKFWPNHSDSRNKWDFYNPW